MVCGFKMMGGYMALDLSSLQKAVSSLERAIKVASETKGVVSIEQEEVIRAGVIQNFEFTYELCWKFMKRWLEKNVGRLKLGMALKELVDGKALYQYPVLKEKENGLVAQAEHTMIVQAGGALVTTK